MEEGYFISDRTMFELFYLLNAHSIMSAKSLLKQLPKINQDEVLKNFTDELIEKDIKK